MTLGFGFTLQRSALYVFDTIQQPDRELLRQLPNQVWKLTHISPVWLLCCVEQIQRAACLMRDLCVT